MVDSRLLEITLQCAHTYGTRLRLSVIRPSCRR